MRRHMFLIVALLVICSSVSFAKTVKRHYPDGAIESIASYNKKGVRNGHYTKYWANGKVMENGTYKNGELVGTVKRFSIDGEPLD